MLLRMKDGEDRMVEADMLMRRSGSCSQTASLLYPETGPDFLVVHQLHLGVRVGGGGGVGSLVPFCN